LSVHHIGVLQEVAATLGLFLDTTMLAV